jgi:transcriptional regulator GlxA family with amidase domain
MTKTATFTLMLNRVIFFIASQTHILDLAGPVQVFYESAEYGHPYEIIYLSDQPEKACSSGLMIGQLQHINDVHIRQDDIIFIPGFQLQADNQALRDWLIHIAHAGATLCSVCTGSFALAAAGILDGHGCTTHWKYTQRLQEEYPETKVFTNRLFVKSGNIYTSAGITTGIDLALFIIEERHGPAFAWQLAAELVVYIRRDGDDSQQSVYLRYRRHINNHIHQVQDYIIHHLDQKLSLDVLAALVHTGSRNLTRMFKAATGITIGQYIDSLRVEKAVNLLKEKNKVAIVAQQCGFKSVVQLRTMVKKYTGELPSKMS